VETGAAPSKFVWPYTDLFALTARLSDFVVPGESSWLRAFVTGFDAPDTGRGEYTHGQFLGYTTLLMAGLGVWGWWRGSRRARTVPFLALVLMAAALLALLPPEFQLALPGLGAFSLNGPAYLGYAVAPWFREYARFGVLVLLAAVALAAFGLRYAWDRWPKPRATLLGVLAVGLIFDFSYRLPPDFPLDTTQVPAVYRWLAEQPGSLTVAEYPIPRSSQVSPVYLFYVTQHGQRIVDGQGFSRQAEQIMPALWDLGEPQTASVLRYLGADYVIWHETWPGYEQWYGALPNTAISLMDWEVVERFDTALVLRVRAEAAQTIVVPGAGFTLAPAPDLSQSWWWLNGTGDVRLYNTTDEPLTVSVRFFARTPGGIVQLGASDAAGQPLPITASQGEAGPEIVVGPVTVPPARLREQLPAEALTIHLTAATSGAGPMGLRGFQVTTSAGK
jgi:hypothetical protein